MCREVLEAVNCKSWAKNIGRNEKEASNIELRKFKTFHYDKKI